MEKLKSLVPENCNVLDIDGIRMDFKDSCVLIRPSGTEPIIRINAESQDEKIIKKLLDEWKKKVEETIKEVRK